MESIAQIKAVYQAAEEAKLPDFIRSYENDSRAGVRALCAQAQKRLDKAAAERARVGAMRAFENEVVRPYALALQDGGLVCGVDEAGRGPLAGPVAAGACILPPNHDLLYLNDSKKLSEARREQLYDEIVRESVAWSVGLASPERIDEINILQATYEAMRQAISALSPQPAVLVNDAVRIPGVRLPQVPVIKGDAKCISVAAASILAKVTRDRLMYDYDRQYPQYGFAANKGYGSPEHIAALRAYGPCPIHRRTFIMHFVQGQAAGGASSIHEAARQEANTSTAPASARQGQAAGGASSARALGTKQELAAAAYLRARGIEILEHSFHGRQGEIDLIGRDGERLCFIEVKYRSSPRCGEPEEAVTPEKQRAICRTADYYRLLHRLGEETPVRFDVVAVHGDTVHWIKDAFPYRS